MGPSTNSHLLGCTFGACSFFAHFYFQLGEAAAAAAEKSTEKVVDLKEEPVKWQSCAFEDKSLTNSELHSMLAAVDPARAAELHPNDRRKVANSMEGKLGATMAVGVGGKELLSVLSLALGEGSRRKEGKK